MPPCVWKGDNEARSIPLFLVVIPVSLLGGKDIPCATVLSVAGLQALTTVSLLFDYSLITRFTVGQHLPVHHPFHCWTHPDPGPPVPTYSSLSWESGTYGCSKINIPRMSEP